MKATPGKTLKIKRTKKRGEQKRTGGGDGRRSGLTAADIMVQEVITVRPEAPVDEVSELFQMSNISGAPVVKEDGELIGIVTEDDIVFGQMGFTDEELDGLEGGDAVEKKAGTAAEDPARETEGTAAEKEDGVQDSPHKVGEIMTPNPIAVEESTPLEEICRIMSRLRIHRVPVVRDRKVTGIISTVDICRLIVEGKARLVPTGE